MKELDRRPRLRLSRSVQGIAIAAVGALALAACSSSGGSAASSGSASGSASGTVTVAAVVDLTGANSTIGTAALAGTLTAAQEINAAGGVNGSKIVVKTFDAQSSVTAAGSVIRDAETSKPAAIVGEVVSSELAPAASVIGSGGVPWVTVNTPSSITNGFNFWFTSAPGAQAYGQSAVGGLKELLGGSLSGKTIALQGLDSPAVNANLAEIKSGIQTAGGTVGASFSDPLSINSWSSEAAKVVADHADAIVLNDNEPVTAIVAKALGAAGFSGPILSLSGASSDSLLTNVSLSNFYVLRETVIPPTSSPVAAAAEAAKQPADDISNPFFLKSYANLYVVAKTLEKCGASCSQDSFASTLKGLGNITIPNGVVLGPLNFSSAQCGITASKVWVWDPAKQASVSKGQEIAITS
jgi:branched-chain amino acid transport system substrate-binding protein